MRLLLMCALLLGLCCVPVHAGNPLQDVKSKFEQQDNAVHFVQRSDLYGDILLRFNNFVLDSPEAQESFYASMQAAQQRAEIHELHLLHYGDGGFARGGMKFLEAVPELRLLSLGGARYSAEDLDYLQHCKKLERLYISGPVKKTALEGIAKAPSIQLLRFQRAVAEWEHFPALPELMLLDAEHSNLDDTGAEALQKSGKLKIIYAYSTNLSDKGLEHLAKIESLEMLGVECPNITQAGIEKFQKARPDVEFVTKKPRPRPRQPRGRNAGGELAILRP